MLTSIARVIWAIAYEAMSAFASLTFPAFIVIAFVGFGG